MDPLSITAGIITVLQVTNTIISICYDYKAALKKAPWPLTRVLDEAKGLRSVLESLEQHVVDGSMASSPFPSSKSQGAFKLLFELDRGPLAACLRELTTLEGLLGPSKRASKLGSMGRAFDLALGWTLKDSDVRLCLERIERCKSSLLLAITADEAYVAALYSALQ
jgi:hypothetical protein